MVELPDSLKTRLRTCRTLPSVPTVVIEVLDLCEQEDVGIPEITKVLARDPALTTKVLRVANSAFYAVRSEVATVDRAISIMGINATLSLALSFSFVGNMNKLGKGGFDHAGYWQRSAIMAASARALGEWTDQMSRDELFFAGLLQDIGMLVLNEAIPEAYGKIMESAKQHHHQLVNLEKESLGTNHGTVGSWILERWKLPANLRQSVEASHNPQLLDGLDKNDYRCVLALASHIAEIWCDPDTTAATGRARHYASDLLEISDEKFEWILGSIAASLPEVTQNLDIDVGGEEQVNKLLDQAREALVILNLQAQRQVSLMRNLAETDGLTSLYNRGYLESILPQFFDKARQAGEPLSVIFADIDHFKMVNDAHGHQIGDTILVSVARLIKSAMRSSDIAARYGGEEFVCLLPNTPEDGAEMVAERLRKAMSLASHRGDNSQKINVTASFGCATFSPDSTFSNPAEFLEEADRCLYVAKRTGRNRVVSTKSLPDKDNRAGADGDSSENARIATERAG